MAEQPSAAYPPRREGERPYIASHSGAIRDGLRELVRSAGRRTLSEVEVGMGIDMLDELEIRQSTGSRSREGRCFQYTAASGVRKHAERLPVSLPKNGICRGNASEMWKLQGFSTASGHKICGREVRKEREVLTTGNEISTASTTPSPARYVL